MSGFAAVWNTDGAPIDEALLIRMQEFLSSRGPDEQRRVMLGANKNVGLVHAAFQTTSHSNREHQPCTIDGVAWLNGHIRIDAREQLSNDLRSCQLSRAAPTDAQMVLQAYKVWGRSFVNRIVGDYSFVIWNEQEQRLLAVRDHLGTRPLFYARAGRSWILSNTLDCVRLHPGVSGKLDDIWVVNFLTNTHRADFERSAYREIKRLPPGHVLDVIPSGGIVRQYWKLEIGEPIYYKRRDEYFEQFRELAKTAIRDRLRIGRVGIGMSGGLDSTSIVAFLLQLVGDKANDIVVMSAYFEKLIYDEERRYAAAAAEHFGIPIKFRNIDSTVFDCEWWTRSSVPPEPSDHIMAAQFDPALQDPFRGIRVLFIGHGPDDALVNMDARAYLRWLLKTGRFIEFVSAVHFKLNARPLRKRLPGLRAVFRHEETSPVSEKPAWVRHDILDHPASSSGLGSQESKISDKRHPWHPRAVASFRSPVWQDYFDSYDAGFKERLIEAVHPYLDVRMVQFLLSIPVVPWCQRKLLVRESMRGLLPEVVLTRDKTPLVESPWIKAMVKHTFPPISNTPELARYVEVSKVPKRWAADVQQNRWIRRVLCLQHWLAGRNARPIRPLISRSAG